MAKCSLAIELDEPDRLYTSNDRIRGTVVVRADDDVQCKALKVRSGWATHGRGNIDSNDLHSEVLFQGQWRSGEEHRYRFDLPVSSWPPTYHGTFLNVDHYIHATADIPWAFDPKESQPYRVVSSNAPGAGVVEKDAANNAIVGGILKFFFIGLALFMLLNPMLWILAFPIGIGGGVWWFLKSYLPKKLLGDVEYTLNQDSYQPGETLQATLRVHPKKDIPINSVIWTVTGVEACVSGSGSNRRTHRHELFHGGKLVDELRTLPGNKETLIPLELQLPDKPCFTMNLGSNQIAWKTTICIDIPRWPDWNDSRAIQLAPSKELVQAVTVETIDSGGDISTQPTAAAGEEPDVTFAATLEMIQSVIDDDKQVDRIVDAVRDLPMQLNLIPQRRELYSSSSKDHAYADGHVVIGQTIDPVMPVTMFIPRSLADEFDQATDRPWSGEGSIVGYDHRQNRLQLRIEP
ncbi:hypothetical protein CA51_44510 [Rosistilla oblonga]|uniref:hypothetical protein n=1 Tax=Rosistilla oblonga TaxID=2527990 RepID=UPI00118D2552|nr:hypothetical protein [Rosistilla oblonga]QDV14543.1 hypothetical protein CA51_44510 [Rosistilla oblonga]